MMMQNNQMKSITIAGNDRLQSSSFYTNIFGTDDPEVGSEVGANEVHKFFQATKIKVQSDVNPLVRWRDNQRKFPNMALLAKDIFSIQTTPVTSESVFSRSGRLVSEHRASLSDDSISSVMLLQSWLQFFKEKC